MTAACLISSNLLFASEASPAILWSNAPSGRPLSQTVKAGCVLCPSELLRGMQRQEVARFEAGGAPNALP